MPNHLLRFCCLPILLLLATGSVLAQSFVSVPNPNHKHDVAIVDAYLRSLMMGDLEKARIFLQADCISDGPGIGDSVDVTTHLNDWKTNFDSFRDQRMDKITTSFRVAEPGPMQGNWVMVWGWYFATSRDQNIQVRFPFHLMARIRDGKIDYIRTYFNRMDIMEELGMEIQMPVPSGDP